MLKVSLSLGLASATAFALALGVGCFPTSAEETEATGAAASAAPSNLLITQVYSGGGVKGAAYGHDYVEIFNRGAWSVSLDGIALQIADTGADFDAAHLIKLPSKTLMAGKYFLVQLGGDAGAATGRPLPTAEFSSDIGMTAATGKVALVRQTQTLTGCGSQDNPCRPGRALSLVSYGGADAGAPLGELSGTMAAKRKDSCVDTGSLQNDFEVVAPAPRNGEPAATPCAVPPANVVDGGASLVRINEVKVAAEGGIMGSLYGYAELLCTPKASLGDHYFIATDASGLATLVIDLSPYNCGANGLLYIKASGADQGHLSGEGTTKVLLVLPVPDAGPMLTTTTNAALMIVKSPVPIALGTDFDGDDNGTADLPSNATIVDGIAVAPADAKVPKYVPKLVQPAGMAAGATRIVNNTAPLSADAWFGGGLKSPDATQYDPAKLSANAPKDAVLTPGKTNFAAVAEQHNGNDGGTPEAGADASPTTPPPGATTETSPTEPEKNPVAPPAPGPGLHSADSVCSASPGPAPAGFGAFAMLGIALAALRRRSSRRS